MDRVKAIGCICGDKLRSTGHSMNLRTYQVVFESYTVVEVNSRNSNLRSVLILSYYLAHVNSGYPREKRIIQRP